MPVASPEELEGMERASRVVSEILSELASGVRAGVTTGELDARAAELLEAEGARSAPIVTYDFPGATCISVSPAIAHGIPGEREIREGELVNIDVSAEVDGYFGDVGATIPVPPVSDEARALCRATREALELSVAVIGPDVRLNAVGRAVEAVARKRGFRVIRNLCGHGVGRSLHEEPHRILNYFDPTDRRRFREGNVVTIEPFLSTGADAVTEGPDGWTLSTPDGSPAAQYEHTVVVTAEGRRILTELP